MTFEDTFSGTAIDTTKWTIRDTPYNAKYRAGNAYKDGVGNLVLRIDKPSTTVYGGRIDGDQKWSQQYGFFECRAQTCPTQQTLFAFWMSNYPGVNAVDGTGHDGAEIDIVETMASGDNYNITFHWDGYGVDHKSTGNLVTAPNLHVGYHVYGLEWNSASLKFYYDGTLKWSYSGVAVPYVNEFMLLSSEHSFGAGNIANAALPYYCYVDYVRAWQLSGTTVVNPSDDATIRDGTYASTNYGATTDMIVKNDVASWARQSVLKFNFGSYAGSSVSSAKLRLFVAGAGTDASRTLTFMTATEAWAQGTVTWNTAPAYVTSIGDKVVSNAVGVWVEQDVTAVVNAQMTDKIIAFKIKNQTGAFSGNGNISFNSKEAASNKPELVLTP
ncbi:MAG: glycoside hydrolase family 16 protein [Nitrospira sp.]|nr:glycoside hydrolase family 16 protein [Nitrospira sp.]